MASGDGPCWTVFEHDPRPPLKTLKFLMANSMAHLDELAAKQGAETSSDGSAQPQATGVGKGGREGVVGGAQHGQEQRRLAELAVRLEVGQGIAGPVDEELLARLVLLAHDEIDATDPGAVALGKPGVAVALGVKRAVLTPEKAQGDVLAGQLGMDRYPVGLARVDHRLATVTVEALLKLLFAASVAFAAPTRAAGLNETA